MELQQQLGVVSYEHEHYLLALLADLPDRTTIPFLVKHHEVVEIIARITCYWFNSDLHIELSINEFLWAYRKGAAGSLRGGVFSLKKFMWA